MYVEHWDISPTSLHLKHRALVCPFALPPTKASRIADLKATRSEVDGDNFISVLYTAIDMRRKVPGN